MTKEFSGRRKFVRKLVGVAAVGGASTLLLGRQVEKVNAVAGTGVSGQVAYWSDSSGTLSSFQSALDSANNSIAFGTGSTATGLHSTVGGGSNNTAPSSESTVAGGASNVASGSVSTIGGGYANATPGACATVGGGTGNAAGGAGAFVGGGGYDGTGYSGNAAMGIVSTIAGGLGGTASAYASTVGGGIANAAGGSYSTVGGGWNNAATGDASSVGGGILNAASGQYSTVPGGYLNEAGGNYSFAAGTLAKVQPAHTGAIVFSDHSSSASGVTFNSVAANEFAVRATGGVRFVTTIDTSGHTVNQLTVTSGGWVGAGTTSPSAMLHSVAPNNSTSPIIAQGYSNSGTNLQEWRKSDGTTLSVVDKDGKIGAGTAFPSASLQGETSSTNGTGVRGLAGAITGTAIGVYGESTAFVGVHGQGGAVSVWGSAPMVTTVPIVAQGTTGQTGNLQEWRNVSGSAFASVNASGSLGVWNSNPQFNVHVIGTTDPASVTVDGIGIVGPNFQFRRARGTASSPSAVMSGDGILFLVGKGYGSTGFSPSGRANLSMYAAHTWTDTQQGTFMSFKTTASGTTTQTEKMRITDTGNILPASDNSGNIGIASQRWALVRAVTITPGDLLFENGYRVTEDKNAGLAFKNDRGDRIAVLDREGNWHIKGKVVEDL